MTVSAGCSVQFDSARSHRSSALEYLLEEVTITGEGRLQRRDLLDGHPAGITDLSPVRPEIVVLGVRQPPVQCVGPSGRDAFPNLPHRSDRHAYLLLHLADDSGLLSLTGLHLAAERRPISGIGSTWSSLNHQHEGSIQHYGNDGVRQRHSLASLRHSSVERFRSAAGGRFTWRTMPGSSSLRSRRTFWIRRR